MVGRKVISNLLLVFVLISALLVGCTQPQNLSKEGDTDVSQSDENQPIKIGITQIVEHPALDAAREGFVDALKSNGFKNDENIEIDFQNAQGDMSIAQTIAENFVSKKKDMILAIATPVAQAAYNATKDIPILITAVTDPVEAGLVKSFEKSGTNVAGTSDAVPLKKQFRLLKKLIPDAKKVGILFNTSEINSEIQVNKAKELASGFGLEIITSGVTNVNDVSQSLDSLLQKVDVLYTPTDNVIASAMPLISEKCFEKMIPIIGAEEAHVNSGALATEGIDYYSLGYQTGLVAIDIINGKEPKDMSVTTLEDTKLVINKESAEKLNINIPNDLEEAAEIVNGGENNE